MPDRGCAGAGFAVAGSIFLPLLCLTYSIALGAAVAPRLSRPALLQALQAPRLATGALAAWVALTRRGRPWTAAERVGLTLATLAMLGAVAALWGDGSEEAWQRMRWVSAVAWLLVAAVVEQEARRAR
jgi:hypothetical protein